jgi:transposase InsO family protein
VLREQGCPVAARTYRAWKSRRVVAARTYRDAAVMDALIATRGTPEGLYGRRKMVAHLRRSGFPGLPRCTVDRLMHDLNMAGVRRGRGVKTTVPAKGGQRASDLVKRDFTAPAPNTRWIADFTYCRTWAGFVYVAFVVDMFAQKIVGWHAATSKQTDLVLVPLRIAAWQRGRDGHPLQRGQLLHHSDAGSQGGFNWSSQHLVVEVLSGSSAAGSGSGDSSEVEVARSSEVPTPCRGGVLGGDRQGVADRRGRGRGRRGASGGGAVVP